MVRVDFQCRALNSFAVDQVLTLHEGPRLALFFIDAASLPGSFQAADSGLTFELGEMTCPYAVPDSAGCSSARFATTVSDGLTTKAAPCRDPVGGFTVTSSYELAGQAPASCKPNVGFCDATSSFVASGVR